MILHFLLIATLVFGAEPIPGDINLDGKVDFNDFIVLAQNFGKSGPLPNRSECATEQAKRANELVGFWTFTVHLEGIAVSTDFVLAHPISRDVDTGENEIMVLGALGLVLVGAVYDIEEKQYVLAYKTHFSSDTVTLIQFTFDGSYIAQGRMMTLPADGSDDYFIVRKLIQPSGRMIGQWYEDTRGILSKVATKTEPVPPEILELYRRVYPMFKKAGIF